MRKIFIFIVCLFAAAALAVFFYRYQIMHYSAEKAIRGALPGYVKMDSIRFDFKESRVVARGLRILNPSGFSQRYLLDIDEVNCRYKLRGATILDGIEIADPVLIRPVLYIERSKDARVNLIAMQAVVTGETDSSGAASPGAQTYAPVSGVISFMGNKALHDMLRIPETYSINGGKLIFMDSAAGAKPVVLSLESVSALVTLRLDGRYAKVLRAASEGEGFINGDSRAMVKWRVSLDPTTPKLTMSNRFEVSPVDIALFEPYYDKYSPFIFSRGKFFGTLIFDFDNGSIGSTNEVHIENMEFSVKKGYETADFCGSDVQNFVKYFTSSSGDIVFDFKIKGPIADPKFMLGPISKKALAAMAVDKVSDALQDLTKPGQAQAGKKSDIEKAQEYITLFKGLIEKGKN